MSRAKHTPGPWDSGGTLEIVAGKWGTDCPTIAEAHSDLPRGLDGYANARLIAASPDLLEALDEADTAFMVINIGSDEPMNPQARQAMRKAWEKAQTALAKALGRVDLFKEEEEK